MDPILRGSEVSAAVPVSSGHDNDTKAPIATNGAAVRPGHRSPVAQGRQSGKTPLLFTAQPLHVPPDAAILRGGGHTRGAHDANEVGAALEI